MTSPEATPLDQLLAHRAWVRGLVRSLVLDASSADDVEQQVWLSAVEQAPARIAQPRAWLAAVARNWAKRAHRGASRRIRREASVARPEAQAADDDPVERAEAHRGVVEAVLRLPEPLRTSVLLHYFDGLSAADTAARLGVPHETVRSRLRLARARLRDELAPADASGRAVFAPALLVLADLPARLALPTSTTISGGTIAMAASQKLVLAVALPAVAGIAWITARAAAPEAPADRSEEVAALLARVEKFERTAEAPRSRPPEDRALVRRIDELEARLAERDTSVRPAVATTSAAGQDELSRPAREGARAAPSGSEPDDAAAAELRELAAGLEKLAVDLVELSEGIEAAPGTPEHRAAMKRLADQLVKSAVPPAVESDIRRIEAVFDGEARRGRVSPVEAEDLAAVAAALASGNAARAGLAKAVAGGWAKDPRLSEYLTRHPSNAEPAVHRALMQILDHTPSAAFSDYLVRIVREEKDPTVLASALDADRIEAAATPDAARRVAEAVESRLLAGGLDAKLRSRAACAVAIAWMGSPESGAEALRRIAAAEPDQELAGRCRKAADSLLDRTASKKSLEKAFK